MIKMLIKIKSFKKKFADQNKDLIKKKSWLSLSRGYVLWAMDYFLGKIFER